MMCMQPIQYEWIYYIYGPIMCASIILEHVQLWAYSSTANCTYHLCQACSAFTSDAICHSHRQVPLKHHPFAESSPSKPNEHVEIQWILICCYTRTRDKSGGFIRREIEKKGPHFLISCTFSLNRIRREEEKTISFETIISVLLDGEVLKGES